LTRKDECTVTNDGAHTRDEKRGRTRGRKEGRERRGERLDWDRGAMEKRGGENGRCWRGNEEGGDKESGEGGSYGGCGNV